MTHATSLWLIRHGETEWSLSGAHTGRTDIPLTPAGEKSAAEIGRHLAGHPFNMVLTSPLARARETCRIAGFAGVAVVEPSLREWDYGAYEGRTTAEIRQEAPGWSIWTSGARDGETSEQVAARARTVIERCAAAGGDVALFAHGHLLRVLAACWLHLPPAAGRLLALSTASLSILGYERDTRVIRLWNRTFDANAD
jgi:broad specificity phosphatase PhoE